MTSRFWRGFRLLAEGIVETTMELFVMKLTTLLAAGAVMFVFAHSAQAGVHHRRLYVSEEGRIGSAAQYGDQYGGRPAAWCGWEMRQLVGSAPGPTFNLARNWVHWGQPGPAGVGAVVVWSHHVGKIVGQENGQWIVQSGNDDRAVRSRARSLAGVIAIRWG
jgi:hypothetical protein